MATNQDVLAVLKKQKALALSYNNFPWAQQIEQCIQTCLLFDQIDLAEANTKFAYYVLDTPGNEEIGTRVEFEEAKLYPLEDLRLVRYQDELHNPPYKVQGLKSHFGAITFEQAQAAYQ